MKALVKLLGITVFVSSVLLMQPHVAHAYSQTRLMDDSVFTNHDSMTQSEINTWLSDEAGFLSSWSDDVDITFPGKRENDGDGNKCLAHIATGLGAHQIIKEAAQDWQAQYVIWRDGNGDIIPQSQWEGWPQGDISSCNSETTQWADTNLETINPQALLTTLQKEQSLITATGSYSSSPSAYENPSCCSNEYKLAWAMGYGVPDSGGKNHRYIGFYSQVNWAAWQLRFNHERSQGNTGWDDVGSLYYSGPMIEGSFKRCGSCSVEQFDGYYSVDGQNLYMENSATASLYRYTPHTCAEGGGCGNANFVSLFENWFGPAVSGFKAKFISKSSNPNLSRTEEKVVTFRFKNVGDSTWYDTIGSSTQGGGTPAVRLATNKDLHRNSKFGDAWATNNRPSTIFSRVYKSDGVTLTSNQNKATKGHFVEFDVPISIRSTQNSGVYTEFFKPITTGGNLLPEPSGDPVKTIVTVQDAIIDADFISASRPGPRILQGEAATTTLRYKNLSNVAWYDKTGSASSGAPYHVTATRLSTDQAFSRNSDFGEGWPSRSRPAIDFSVVYESNGSTLAANQHKCVKNQFCEFDVNLVVENLYNSGNYTEHFVPHVSSLPKITGMDSSVLVRARLSTYIAEFHSKSGNPTLNAGDSTTVAMKFTNAGNAHWYDNSNGASSPTISTPFIRLVTDDPKSRSSIFGENWPGVGYIWPTVTVAQVFMADGSTLAPDQTNVAPGEVARFEFDIDVPLSTSASAYVENFTPYLNLPDLFEDDLNVGFTITVN